MTTQKTANPAADRLKAAATAEKLYRKAVSEDKQEVADAILETTKLFVPGIRFRAAPEPKTRYGMTGKSVDNSADRTTDLSDDEAMWNAYTDILDGGPARRRAEEDARENDAILDRYYRKTPEAAPHDWRKANGY